VAPPKIDILRQRNVDFTYYLFLLHYSLKRLVDFWKVISNKNLTKQNEIKDFYVLENLVIHFVHNSEKGRS